MRKSESFRTDVGVVTVILESSYDDFYNNVEYYLISVDVNYGDCLYERIVKETKEEAVNVFKCLCEKYRPKRDKLNKDGETIKYLRKMGFNAIQMRDVYSGIRKGILVYFVNVYGKEQVADYKPNNLIGTPEILAEAISDHLVRCRCADIEKGRERYGLK